MARKANVICALWTILLSEEHKYEHFKELEEFAGVVSASRSEIHFPL
jgi:hypothetical protein